MKFNQVHPVQILLLPSHIDGIFTPAPYHVKRRYSLNLV